MSFIYKKLFYRRIFVGTIVTLTLLMLLSVSIGIVNISPFEIIKIILNKIPLINKIISSNKADATTINSIIILKIRIPRVLLAAIVGAGLSVTGAVFQAIFKNPMAEPYVLGVSSGAALGATIAIVIGLEYTLLGMGFITIAAFVSSALTIFIVYNIAKIGSKTSTNAILLAGIAMTHLLSSIISIIMIFNKNQVEKIIFWIMGSVSSANWQQICILLPIVTIGSIGITIFSRNLNIIAMGDSMARSVGIEVETTKKILLIICSIIVASCVSITGIIGFVGLVVPHVIRLLLVSDYRVVIPFSVIIGAMFMVASDTIARNIVPPAEMPVGAITAAFGAPYFIYLLYKSKKGILK